MLIDVKVRWVAGYGRRVCLLAPSPFKPNDSIEYQLTSEDADDLAEALENAIAVLPSVQVTEKAPEDPKPIEPALAFWRFEDAEDRLLDHPEKDMEITLHGMFDKINELVSAVNALTARRAEDDAKLVKTTGD